MDEFTLALLIMLFAGAFPSVLGWYLIAIKQKRHLISGFDEAKISHPEAYAKLVGNGLFVMGLLIAGIATCWYLGLVDEIGMTAALLIATFVPILFVVVANKKYKLSTRQ